MSYRENVDRIVSVLLDLVEDRATTLQQDEIADALFDIRTDTPKDRKKLDKSYFTKTLVEELEDLLMDPEELECSA